MIVYYFIFSLQKMPLKHVDTFIRQHLLRAGMVRLSILLLALSFMNYHKNNHICCNFVSELTLF